MMDEKGGRTRSDRGKALDARIAKAAPAAILVLVGAALMWWSVSIVRATAPVQAEIEKMVGDTNTFAAGIAKIKGRTAALLDPMALAMKIDKDLIAHGLPGMTVKEFKARVAAEDRQLLASGSAEYIDACAQREEIEWRMLYEGIHPPLRDGLPGWPIDWRTRCRCTPCVATAAVPRGRRRAAPSTSN